MCKLVGTVIEYSLAAQKEIAALEAERDELVETIDGVERGVISLAAENVKLAAERDALRARLAETWTPVEDGTLIGLPNWFIDGQRITFRAEVDGYGGYVEATECLPSDLRLCRRTTPDSPVEEN